MVTRPPRPGSLYDFRMQEVAFEIKTLSAGEALHRRAQVAGYFYHVLGGEIEVRSTAPETFMATTRDTVVVGTMIEHSIVNASARPVELLIGAEPFEYLTWLPNERAINHHRGNSRHPLTRRLLLAMDLVVEEISDTNAPPDQLTLERTAELIIFYFFRMANPVTAELDPFPWSDKRLMATVSAMQTDPAHNWTIDQLAELAHMSRSAFCERFKQVLGESPMRMVAEIRLKLAARLMLEGQPLSIAALQSGYDSVEGFNRAFKRQFGITPGRWLREKTA